MSEPAIESRVEYDATYLRVLPDGEWWRCGDLDAITLAPPVLRDRLARGWHATEAVSGDPVRAPMKIILPADVAAMLERAAVKLRTTSTVQTLRTVLAQFVNETITQSPVESCTHIH